ALLAGCDLLNKMTDDVKDSEKTDILNIYERLSSLLENSSASSKNRQDTKECQSSVEIQEEPQAPVEVQETSPADEESLAFDREMIDIFVSESKENLENIRQDFLILEKQASDSDQNLIDKVFRTIHSVKGSAGMLGFEKTSKLANSMEALLRKMRSGEIRPEPQYVRSLLTGYDILVKMVDNIDDSQKMDIQEAHERILNLLENPVLPAVPKSDPEEEPAKEDSVQSSMPDPEEEPVKEDSVQPTKPKSDTEEESVKENVVLPAEPEFDPGKEADAESSSAKITPPVAKGHRDHSDTVRIKVELLNLLMTLAGELVLVRNQHLLIVDEIDPETRGISQRMDMVTTQLQEAIMRTRMQPVGNLFAKLPRIVRDVSKRTGKYIQIHTVGDEVELDKTILESLSDPLTHIIRNACDHGIEMPDERYRMNKPETGAIHVHAFHEAGQINIVIRDDGGGMDTEVIKKEALKRGLKSKDELNRMNERDILSIIMMPGFSTSEKTTEISGRGVGMDVVRSSVEQQGGSVEMISEKGEGTAIHLRLPLTLAIIPCLIVEIGDERYAIPKVSVDELVCLYDEE
ncbi:MAG TPA: chemotaxis protein CheA, partial [Desulfobacterales bacterium]|nr:chemotaxis protein CheA [Desulfobacterales bacterium]